MTNRTWDNTLTAYFTDPLAWTPNGLPMAGDSLTIQDGNPVAVGEILDGYTIYLGGPNDSPGPAYSSVPGDGIKFKVAPDPTLSLINSTIGSDTTIVVPAVPRLFPRGHVSSPYSATLFVTGGSTIDPSAALPVSENDGLIKADGSWLMQGGTLNLSIGNAILENRGTIYASPDSSIVLTGYKIQPEFIGLAATMHNDGTIAVYGSVADTTVNIDGSGTILLGSSPGLLNLAPSPGHFEFDNSGETIGAGQTVRFQGGHLDLQAAGGFNAINGFHATLSNFGGSVTDLITLNDFNIHAATFANGTLAMSGTNMYGTSEIANLTFTSVPAFGQFHLLRAIIRPP